MNERELDGIRNNSIKNLNLTGKKIGDDGAKALAQYLLTNISLTSIDFFIWK